MVKESAFMPLLPTYIVKPLDQFTQANFLRCCRLARGIQGQMQMFSILNTSLMQPQSSADVYSQCCPFFFQMAISSAVQRMQSKYLTCEGAFPGTEI